MPLIFMYASSVTVMVFTAMFKLMFKLIFKFCVVFLIRQFVVSNLNVQDVQAEVFIDRVLYSPNGILYFDSGPQRAVPGLIDTSKLKTEVLDSLMDYKNNNFIAANITLFG